VQTLDIAARAEALLSSAHKQHGLHRCAGLDFGDGFSELTDHLHIGSIERLWTIDGYYRQAVATFLKSDTFCHGRLADGGQS